jgi:hypothetical protein
MKHLLLLLSFSFCYIYSSESKVSSGIYTNSISINNHSGSSQIQIFYEVPKYSDTFEPYYDTTVGGFIDLCRGYTVKKQSDGTSYIKLYDPVATSGTQSQKLQVKDFDIITIEPKERNQYGTILSRILVSRTNEMQKQICEFNYVKPKKRQNL